MTAVPALGTFNMLRLRTPESAVLATVVFSVLATVAPIPCIWAIDRMLGLLHLA